MTLGIMTIRINTHNIVILRIMTLSIMILRIVTISLTPIKIMTLNIATLTLKILIFSITRITNNENQQSNTQNNDIYQNANLQ